jgi:hypothetical protein
MNDVTVNKMIHDLAREVVDKHIEIDDERQGDKFADELYDEISATVQIFVDSKKSGGKS